MATQSFSGGVRMSISSAVFLADIHFSATFRLRL